MISFARMIFVGILIVASLSPAIEAREPFTLDVVMQKVRRDYSDVGHISAKALVDMVQREENVLLIDVRERAEYSVSHLAGAVRADPDMSRSTFLDRFAAEARDKVVVLYCSVGVRSSKLARRVQEALEANGARQVFNLEGGIFAWHNERRRLVNGKGETSFVHPFDTHWGALVKRQDLTRTESR